MTQALSSTFDSIARRRRAIRVAAWAMGGAAIWLLALLAVMLADGLVALPMSVRIAAAGALLLAGLLLIVMSRPTRDDPRRGPLRDAARIEHQYRLPDNPLINALELAPLHETASDALTRQLAARSVQQGEWTLEQVDVETVLDRRALWRRGGALAGVLLLWGMVAAMLPHLIVGGLARLALPWQDHPPFSFTRIEAVQLPTSVTAGEDVTVSVQLAGRSVAEASLVELDERGEELRRWPMQLAGEDRFTFTLRSVTGPMMFRIEAGDARTRAMRIMPGQATARAGGLEASREARSAGDATGEPADSGATKTTQGEGAVGPGGASGRGEPTTSSGQLGAATDAGQGGDQERQASAVRGAYTQTLAGAQGRRTEFEAQVQQAPAEYRDLVRRYYDRLSRDEARREEAR